jgi:hypothetical protein
MGPIRALVIGFFALASAFSAAAFTVDTSPTTPTNVTGLWWNPNESGWGINLIQESNIVFMTMFTYDGNGTPTWFVASSCAVSAGGCTGDLYRVSGGTQATRPWVSGRTAVATVGSFAVTFFDNSNASITYSIDGVSSSRNVVRQIFAGSSTPPPPPPNDQLAKTQQLLGGTWSFTYTIISTYTDRMSFSSITGPGSTGLYVAIGTDSFGSPVGGDYDPTLNEWLALDPGIIIDQAYVFNFSDLNHVSGCYYQINPPGSSNFSRCYSMSGSRSPPKAATFRALGERLIEEQGRTEEVKILETGQVAPVPRQLLEAYARARERLQHQGLETR